MHWDWDHNKCNLKVGHFEGLKKSELYQSGNVGKKSVKEIEKMLFEAGIILED